MVAQALKDFALAQPEAAASALVAASLVGLLAVATWRHGLLTLLPRGAPKLFQRPLFDLLRDAITVVKRRVLSVIQVVVLLVFSLSEKEKKDIVEGLDPDLRKNLFSRPLGELLPRWLQRLLFGPEQREPDPVPMQTCFEDIPLDALKSRVTPRPGLSPRRGAGRIPSKTPELHENAPQPVKGPPRSGLAAPADDPCLQQVIQVMAGWLIGTSAQFMKMGGKYQARMVCEAIRSLASSTFLMVLDMCDRGLETVRKHWPELAVIAFITTMSSVLGSVLGAFGGAAIGVLPALLTLGLSVPIGAGLGSIVGGCTGTVCGFILACFTAERVCDFLIPYLTLMEGNPENSQKGADDACSIITEDSDSTTTS